MFGIGAAVASLVGSYYGSAKGKREHPERSHGDKKKKTGLPPDKDEIIRIVEGQIARGKLEPSERTCPQCRSSFSLLRVHDIDIDCCMRCKSLWFDSGELQLLTGLSRDVPSDGMTSRDSKHPCPVCGSPMQRRVFARGTNVLVEVCPDKHGVYMDGQMLRRAFAASRSAE